MDAGLTRQNIDGQNIGSLVNLLDLVERGVGLSVGQDRAGPIELATGPQPFKNIIGVAISGQVLVSGISKLRVFE